MRDRSADGAVSALPRRSAWVFGGVFLTELGGGVSLRKLTPWVDALLNGARLSLPAAAPLAPLAAPLAALAAAAAKAARALAAGRVAAEGEEGGFESAHRRSCERRCSRRSDRARSATLCMRREGAPPA